MHQKTACHRLDIDIHDRPTPGFAAYRCRHSELAEGMPVGIAEFDVDGVCRYVNGRYCEMAGVEPDEVVGQLWSHTAHPDDVARIVEEWEAAQAEGRELQIDHRVGRADRGFTWVSRRARVIHDEHGETAGYLSTISDIEERRRSNQALREATTLFTAAFEHAPVGMGIVDLDGRYQQVNQALCALVGRPPEEVVGRHASEFVHPEHDEGAALALEALLTSTSQESQVEGCLALADGTPVWIVQRTTVLRTPAGEPTLLFTQMMDVGKARSQVEQLRHLADHDVLTGLYNRRRFESELSHHLADRRAGDAGAVLLLDLNRFKEINDRYGHHAGDRVLVDVAEVLRKRLRRSDVIGRIGGDEFAVLLRDGDEAGARAVAEMLASAIAGTGTTASIGVTAVESDDLSPEHVLVRADRAMYEVKRGD
jgi:diguanylate cyclase (GGDEF)-like protein/PAS domain S-box-containing protein